MSHRDMIGEMERLTENSGVELLELGEGVVEREDLTDSSHLVRVRFERGSTHVGQTKVKSLSNEEMNNGSGVAQPAHS